jgi:anthranilate synthase/indole-3-glycerol phosphate synthase/phosphoribosylanthranilate isomerase
MRTDDALAAKDAGADFIGVVFAPGSRRCVSIEEAQTIVQALGPPLRELGQAEPPPIYHGPEGDAIEWFHHGAEALERLLRQKRPLVVGVFEDQPMEEVNTTADEAGIDLIQLSGRESWEECLLATRQVVKAVEVAAGSSPEEFVATLQAGTALACLLDVSRGRGVAIDRGVAAGIAARLPVWLAGGLTPENVGEVVRDVGPWAVDVSSGVETEGAKDAAKIRAFVEAAGVASTTSR